MKEKRGGHRPLKRWLRISLRVPGASIEAVSNFLMEQGATGIEENAEDQKGERLKAYFLRDGRERTVLRALRRYLKSLQAIQPEISQAKIEAITIPEQDWGENWKRFFKPLQVTSKFIVKPPWLSIGLKRGQISIDITPAMAFGTGTHATTKLCMQALERCLNRKEGSVLDVGTGSGILSIVAARLGAKQVLGLDTDGVAVEMARENVKENDVWDVVKVKKGSIGKAGKKFSVIVANLDFKTLRRMKWPLVRHLRRQGFLILSGILKEERERIRQYYMETGLLKWERTSQGEEWVCLTFQKK